MTHHLVIEQNHRRSVSFCNIKGLHSHFKHILVIGGRKRNNGMVTVGSPSGLIYIPLAHMGGNARRRTAPLHIDNDTGNFRHNGISQRLLHQRKAGSAGGSHDFMPGKGRPDNGAHGRNLVFHLDKLAPFLGQTAGQMFRDLR